LNCDSHGWVKPGRWQGRIPPPLSRAPRHRSESECYKEHDATQTSKQYRNYNDGIDVLHERMEVLVRIVIRRASPCYLLGIHHERRRRVGGAVVVTYTFLLRLAGTQRNRRSAETIQRSCRSSRPMLNFYGYWTTNGGVVTEATFFNVCTVLLSVSSVPEQYKKTADLSETSVTISRHFDVPQSTSVFNISVNTGVLSSV
jgi:hypothetical protein